MSGAGCVHLSAEPRQAATFVGERGNGWHAPFGASPPSFLPGANLFFVRSGRQSSGAEWRGENDLVYPPPRSETERGRGTARRAVEGACGTEAGRESGAPSTALTR